MTTVHTVKTKEHFLSFAPETADNLTPDEAKALYHFWQQSDQAVALVLDDWVTKDDLNMRRPYLLGTVERNDQDSGAVLFSDLLTLDTGTIENKNYDRFDFGETTEDLDISDESDYIDDAGKMWAPRGCADAFISIEDK